MIYFNMLVSTVSTISIGALHDYHNHETLDYTTVIKQFSCLKSIIDAEIYCR